MDLPPPNDLLPRPLRRALAPAVRFLLRPRPRYVLAWLFALTATGACGYGCWHSHDRPDRGDGNAGHTYIDFGGQWVMGRMLVEGHGRHLYDLRYQERVLNANYPVWDEDPDQKTNDREDLLRCFMGSYEYRAAVRNGPRTVASFLTPLAAPDALAAVALLAAGHGHWTAGRVEEITARPVGGPLYPPIHSLYTFPLALLRPQAAYRVTQALNLLMAWLAGLAVSRLSRGRVWWPLAAALLLGFPGFVGSCDLGQNAALSLALLAWGWGFLADGREVRGGVVWGLLAYKPVWALSFFLVLVLTRRWRACLTMLGTGAALALATLPFVGLHSWFDWLKVGRYAVHVYDYDYNWVHLSRDLLGLPRRWLLDFDASEDVRAGNQLARVLGWAMVGTAAVLTIGLALWRWRQARVATGPPAAFLLLGAWLCCYHFMYYDVLLAALPLFALMAARPRDYLRVTLAALPRRGSRGRAFTFRVSNRGIGLGLVVALIGIQLVSLVPGFDGNLMSTPPFDTYFLILVWLGCGWVWLRTPTSRKDEGEGAAAETARWQLHPSPL